MATQRQKDRAKAAECSVSEARRKGIGRTRAPEEIAAAKAKKLE